MKLYTLFRTDSGLKGPLGQTAARESLVVDQNQQYKITLSMEGKANRTANVYKYICPIFRLDKTSLLQGIENQNRSIDKVQNLGNERRYIYVYI